MPNVDGSVACQELPTASELWFMTEGIMNKPKDCSCYLYKMKQIFMKHLFFRFYKCIK